LANIQLSNQVRGGVTRRNRVQEPGTAQSASHPAEKAKPVTILVLVTGLQIRE
jgi:hypothetical protein